MQAQGRRTRATVVVRLADFSLRYRLPLPEIRKTDLQLFTVHTYYGIFCKGEIRSSYPLSVSVVSVMLVVSMVLWLVQAV